MPSKSLSDKCFKTAYKGLDLKSTLGSFKLWPCDASHLLGGPLLLCLDVRRMGPGVHQAETQHAASCYLL